MSHVRNILLYVTHKCNMNCRYCFDKKHGAVLDESIFPSLDKLINLRVDKHHDNLCIVFMGGEPSLYPSVLEKAVVHYGSKIRYLIMTNGYKWSDEFKSLILKHRNLVVNVSYDGLYQNLRREGSGEEVERSIKFCKDNKINFYITCTVTEHHYPNEEYCHFYENLKYLSKFGAWVFYKRSCNHSILEKNPSYCLTFQKDLDAVVEFVSKQSDGFISLPSRIEEGHSLKCRQRDGSFSCDDYICNDIIVDTDGTLYPCELYLSDKRHPLGHIKDITTQESFDVYEQIKKDTFLLKNKGQILNICPYYNEVINGHPQKVTIDTVNVTVDNMLFSARDKFTIKY